MRIRSLEIGVGAFLLAGLAALVFLVLNVSGLRATTGEDTYRLYARFDQIGGLSVRAKVSMSGVVIGEVSDIRIDPDYLQARVEMRIREDVDYLSTDSSAAILTAGLLGEKYVGITPGGELDNLKDGDTLSNTQSAMVLEELIGRFLFDQVKD